MVNKKIRRVVAGKGYSWSQLVQAVRKDLVEKGLTPASPAVSNAVLGMIIRKTYPLKGKSIDTDSILLEYARHVLKDVA